MRKIYMVFAACLTAGQLFGKLNGDGLAVMAPMAPLPLPAGCAAADAGPDRSTHFATTIGPSTVIPGATYSCYPDTYMFDPNVPNRTIVGNTTSTTGYSITYTLTVSNTYRNLVTNGDFSQYQRHRPDPTAAYRLLLALAHFGSDLELGDNTTATIALYSFSTVSTGNDFAVDNIRLMALCPPSTDEVVVTFIPRGLPPVIPCDTCPPVPCVFCPVPAGSVAEASVYPNPVQGVVHVQLGLAAGVGVQIQVRDAGGNIVRSADGGDIRDGVVSIDVQGLPNGVYTVSVLSGSEVTNRRLVIGQ